MRFTSEDAYAAHEDGDPLTMSRDAAFKTIRSHGADPAEFIAECGSCATYDAWTVLSWLGY